MPVVYNDWYPPAGVEGAYLDETHRFDKRERRVKEAGGYMTTNQFPRRSIVVDMMGVVGEKDHRFNIPNSRSGPYRLLTNEGIPIAESTRKLRLRPNAAFRMGYRKLDGWVVRQTARGEPRVYKVQLQGLPQGNPARGRIGREPTNRRAVGLPPGFEA